MMETPAPGRLRRSAGRMGNWAWDTEFLTLRDRAAMGIVYGIAPSVLTRYPLEALMYKLPFLDLPNIIAR